MRSRPSWADEARDRRDADSPRGDRRDRRLGGFEEFEDPADLIAGAEEPVTETRRRTRTSGPREVAAVRYRVTLTTGEGRPMAAWAEIMVSLTIDRCKAKA